jgi:hypothetical protein
MAASTGGRGVRSSRCIASSTDHAWSTVTSPPSPPHPWGSPVEDHNERSAFVTVCPDVGTARQRQISLNPDPPMMGGCWVG